jgi:hypothetical protein
MSTQKMTDDEARAILQSEDCTASICWDYEKNCPAWWGDSVKVDGPLTERQLLALLHFKPK